MTVQARASLWQLIHTMYVKTNKDNLKAISIKEMDGTGEFSENNIAQVTESDGKTLLEAFPEQFSEHNTEDN